MKKTKTRIAGLSRACRLSPREWLLLVQLIAASAAFAAALRVVRVETLVRALRRASGQHFLRRLPAGHAGADRGRLAELADAAARATSGRARCLPRSLLLLWLTWARGEHARLFLGAARAPGGRFEAHAWVEDRRGPLAESPSLTRRYATFMRFPG